MGFGEPLTLESMSAPHAFGQALLRVGLTLVLIGVMATTVTLVPLLAGTDPLPVAFYLLAMLAPVGLALILSGLWHNARHRSGRRTGDHAE